MNYTNIYMITSSKRMSTFIFVAFVFLIRMFVYLFSTSYNLLLSSTTSEGIVDALKMHPPTVSPFAL